MSIANTLQALATVLYMTDPSPEDAIRDGCIFTDPKEAVTLADFPSIVMYLTPGVSQTFTQEAMGLARHDYTVTIQLFLGVRQTPINELHSRSLPWPEAITRVLVSHLTLQGAVNQIGYGGDPKLVTYKIGPITWGEENGTARMYWGLTFDLPIVEKIPMEMAA